MSPIESESCLLGSIPLNDRTTHSDGEELDILPTRKLKNVLEPHTLLGARVAENGEGIIFRFRSLTDTSLEIGIPIAGVYLDRFPINLRAGHPFIRKRLKWVP